MKESEHVRIRTLCVVYTPAGGAVFPAAPAAPIPAPYFWLFVKPDARGRDVAEIRAVYDAGPAGKFEETLAGDLEVGNAGRFVRRTRGDSAGFTPRGPDGGGADVDDSLAGRLGSLIAEMAEDELAERLPPGDDPRRPGAAQQAADGFVAGLATYLGLVAVMESPEFWDLLPLQWTLGLHARGGNLLNQNSLNYFGLPMHAVSRLAVGLERAVAEGVVGFVNSWGPAFGRGPELESERLVLEVVSGCAGAAVDKLADLHAARRAVVDDLSLAAEAELARIHLELKCRLGDVYSTFFAKASSAFAEACREAAPARAAELAALVDAALERLYPRLRDEVHGVLWNEFSCAIAAGIRAAGAAQEKRIKYLEARLAKVEAALANEQTDSPCKPRPEPPCNTSPQPGPLPDSSPCPRPPGACRAVARESAGTYSRTWGAAARDSARPPAVAVPPARSETPGE